MAHGFVEFEAQGEKITAGRLSDRYGVRAYLHWSRTKSASVTAGRLYKRSKNLAIRERTTVSLTMCYTKNGHIVTCSGRRLGKA